MKRVFSIVMTAALCFGALTACSTAKDTTTTVPDSTAATTTEPETDNPEISTGENTQIPNPWTDYASLDELNAAAGTALHAPAGLDVSDVSYACMHDSEYTLVQYMFTYNGGEYTLRTAATQEDISGVYQDGQTLTDLAEAESDALAFTTDDGALWSRWFDGDTQYSLYAVDAAAEDYTAVRTALQSTE